ncbi:MAG: COX15/CtaA family protein [Acidimicrobiia bacterium]|nr:COX15/CtaA family protein [Acidimicrobiia bacterium]
MSRLRVSPRAFRASAWANVVALVVVVVTGGAVRLTGSGLGCTDWPLCEGALVRVDATSYHPLIESGNRFLTELAGLLILALFVMALLRAPRRRDLVWLSVSLGVTYLLNGVLGAIVVYVDLAPVSVVGHFVLAEACIAIGFVLAHRGGLPDAEDGVVHLVSETRAGTVSRRLAWLLTGLAVWVMMLGTVVTSSGPHAGDPAAERLSFAFADVTRIHSVSAICTLGVAVYFLWHLRRDGSASRSRRPVAAFTVLLVAQGVIGYAQFFAGVPALLVGVHLLGATLVWIAALAIICSLEPPAPVGGDGHRVDRVHGTHRDADRTPVAV